MKAKPAAKRHKKRTAFPKSGPAFLLLVYRYLIFSEGFGKLLYFRRALRFQTQPKISLLDKGYVIIPGNGQISFFALHSMTAFA
jgi:hypothetical protein